MVSTRAARAAFAAFVSHTDRTRSGETKAPDHITAGQGPFRARGRYWDRTVTSSVSGINTVLNTPPLSPKTVRERPVISPPYSRPLSRNSQSPQPPTCRRTSTDVPRVSPQAGTRHGQDIGIGLDGACVVARNRTRRRVAGCGGFPSGPVDLTLQEVRRRVRGAVARRQRSGPEQSSGTRPCGR